MEENRVLYAIISADIKNSLGKVNRMNIPGKRVAG